MPGAESRLSLKAHAKINLALDVIGKRPVPIDHGAVTVRTWRVFPREIDGVRFRRHFRRGGHSMAH